MAKTSNYPGGFLNGLTVRGVPVLNSYAGNVWWVDSGIGSNGNSGKSHEKPFATLDYAVGRCTASNGDLIVIAPGHAETISTATALAIDVAGVSIVGLGTGALRPTFTVGTIATATITFSAANCSCENIIVKSALDGLNTAITVTGTGVYLDIEHQDTSSTVEADIAITCTGDQFTCKLRDIGFTAGDQRDQSIVLTGVDNARIDIDFFGKVGTAVVDFIGTSCTDVAVYGKTYVSGTTNGSKNVVDTVGSSSWYMEIDDMAAGGRYSGGSGAAVASDDVSIVASALVVPTADVTTNTSMRDVVGNKTDAAVTGVTTTKSIMAYLKGALNLAYQASAIGTIAAGSQIAYLPRCVEKSDGSVTSGTDDLFTISGGPIEVLSITGIVTTEIGAGTTNVKLQITTTTPAATTDMNAAAVDIDADAAGTSYRTINTTGIFTPVTAGFVLKANSFATNDTSFLCPIGTIKLNSDASRAGVIKWYLVYRPLSPNSLVTAAT